MQYQITSDNIEVSTSMESLAHEKMKKVENKLQHVNDDLKSFRIVMNSAPENNFEVKIHAVVHGKEYFVNSIEYAMETAMIEAVNELDRVLVKAKVLGVEDDWKEAREAKRLDPDNIEIE